jgi:hypothetical protein
MINKATISFSRTMMLYAVTYLILGVKYGCLQFEVTTIGLYSFTKAFSA